MNEDWIKEKIRIQSLEFLNKRTSSDCNLLRKFVADSWWNVPALRWMKTSRPRFLKGLRVAKGWDKMARGQDTGFCRKGIKNLVPQNYVSELTRTTQRSSEIAGRLIMALFINMGSPLWSSGQSFWLQIQRSRVRFPALPDFLSSSGSGTGSTQPREVNRGTT